MKRLMTAAMLLASAGCTEDLETQFLVRVDSDLRVPEDLTKIVANVRTEDGIAITGFEFDLSKESETNRDFDEYELPVSFGVLAPEDNPDQRIEIEIKAVKTSTVERVLFTRRSLVRFVPGRKVTLPFYLARKCRVLQCAQGQTCTELGCVAEQIELDKSAEEPISLAEVPFTNSKPSSPTITLNTVAPKTTDSILTQLISPSTDLDGDSVSYRYEWYRNNMLVSELTSSMVPPDITKKDELWKVRVFPRDGYDEGDASEAEVRIVNSLPSLSLTVSSSVSPSADDITVSAFVSDADEDEMVVTFRWLLDGTEVQKRSVSTTNLVTDVLTFDQTRRGQDWTIEASVSDGTATSSVARVEVQVANAVPSIVAVVLSPQEVYTNTPITATPQGWADADEDLPGYDYEWFVDDVLVPGQTSSELGSEHFVKGQTVYARVYPNDGFGQGRAVASAPVVVLNSPPSVTAAVVSPGWGIDSTVFECQPTGFVDADGDAPEYQVQWYVDGAPSVTTTTISRPTARRGDPIHCELKVFDGEEYSNTRTSTTTRISAACGPGEVFGETCWPIMPTEQELCFGAVGMAGQITCPGQASSATCGSVPLCGQDAQYAPREPRTFTCLSPSGNVLSSCPTEFTIGEILADKVTGLEWQRTVTSSTGRMSWVQANDYCLNLDYAGRTDWRLPSFRELKSLGSAGTPFYFAEIRELLDHFLSMGSDAWSFSPVPNSNNQQYFSFSFDNHRPGLDPTSVSRGVICVRGATGAQSPVARFELNSVNNETVVRDALTGLVWQYEAQANLNWRDALSYCESSTYAGFDDWRLPNITMLASLWDENSPSGTEFPGGTSSSREQYMSSTTYEESHHLMSFTFNGLYSDYSHWYKLDSFDILTRCVR